VLVAVTAEGHGAIDRALREPAVGGDNALGEAPLIARRPFAGRPEPQCSVAHVADRGTELEGDRAVILAVPDEQVLQRRHDEVREPGVADRAAGPPGRQRHTGRRQEVRAHP
jgi:hypothetical protein